MTGRRNKKFCPFRCPSTGAVASEDAVTLTVFRFPYMASTQVSENTHTALGKPFFPRDSVQALFRMNCKKLVDSVIFLNWSLCKNPPPCVREQASWPPPLAAWRAHVLTTDVRRGGPVSTGRMVLSLTQQGPCRGRPGGGIGLTQKVARAWGPRGVAVVPCQLLCTAALGLRPLPLVFHALLTFALLFPYDGEEAGDKGDTLLERLQRYVV